MSSSSIKANKIQVKTAYDCYHEGIEAVAEACIKMKRFDKVYITFDIDALDPGFAAGTGTPQFGGLTPRMALTLLEKLFQNLNIIGFDVVEIAPPLDPSLAAMFAGRKLCRRFGDTGLTGSVSWSSRKGKILQHRKMTEHGTETKMCDHRRGRDPKLRERSKIFPEMTIITFTAMPD